MMPMMGQTPYGYPEEVREARGVGRTVTASEYPKTRADRPSSAHLVSCLRLYHCIDHRPFRRRPMATLL